MLISDLNYLNEVSSASTDLVGGSSSSYYYNEVFKVYKKIRASSNVRGNIATANADADAYGKNTLTQTFTSAYVDQGYQSNSSSSSIASTNGSRYH